MTVNKKLIPFKFLPASWGLVGQVYKEAEAHYTLDGEDLERALIDIRNEDNSKQKKLLHLELDKKYNVIDSLTYDLKRAKLTIEDPLELEKIILDLQYRHMQINEYDYNIKMAELISKDKDQLQLLILDIDYRHKKLTEYEYEIQKIESTILDETEQKIAKLAIDLKFNKIKQNIFNKETATLRNEPYIEVSKSEFDINQGINGLYFEFDWNTLWINYLRLNGYSGNNEEEVVEKWFSDLCHSVAVESAPVEDEYGNYKNNRGLNIRHRDDGTTERS